MGPVTKPGSGRRTGLPAGDFQPWQSQVAAAVAAREAAELADEDEREQASAQAAVQQQAVAMASASTDSAPGTDGEQRPLIKLAKRKRLDRMASASV